jgi:type II secretory pathway pseudopilin PulG
MTGRASERGVSLIEATVILMVLAVLTSLLAPSVADYVNDVRQVKAAKDVATIGSALEQVMRDVALPCLSLSGSSCALGTGGRVELLVSGSNVGLNLPAVAVPAYTVPNASTASAAALNWAGGSGAVASSRRDDMEHQLLLNMPAGVPANAYTGPSFTSGGGYRAGSGWRGPYMGGGIGLDPWGAAYQANTVFVAIASDAAPGTGEGQLAGGWTSNVIVLSAGADGMIETAFGGGGTAAGGDDLVYVLQGGTR